jgi:hypothetical protein
MGINVTRLEPRTPRSSLRASMNRRSFGKYLTPPASHRCGMAQDPIGGISEMVAKVARERQAKCALAFLHTSFASEN